MNPTYTFILAQWDPIQTFNLKNYNNLVLFEVTKCV